MMTDDDIGSCVNKSFHVPTISISRLVNIFHAAVVARDDKVGVSAKLADLLPSFQLIENGNSSLPGPLEIHKLRIGDKPDLYAINFKNCRGKMRNRILCSACVQDSCSTQILDRLPQTLQAVVVGVIVRR